MDMGVNHGHGLKHGHRHAAWTGTCSMDWGMQHGLGHGQDNDRDYYWTSADNFIFIKFCRRISKSLRKLAKISGVSAYKSWGNLAECISGKSWRIIN